jgi:hypothetical protein
MKYRTLGRTGLEVSAVGFGALPLVGCCGDESAKVLNAALDKGVNFIDTARGYRESEELIGEAVAGRRSEYYLATKTRARHEQGIMQELETSLRNLQTGHLDLYQVHYVNDQDTLDQVLGGEPLRTMHRLRDEKTISYIGITGHNADVLLTAAKTGEFDTVQGAYSYVERGREIEELIDYCARENIGFIVQKPLAGGVLTPAPAAVKWVLRASVSTVIPGMVTVEHVHQNVPVGDGPYELSAQERQKLDQAAAALGEHFCRRCYYCQPACPQNIRIGVILEFAQKAKRPENRKFLKEWYGKYTINATDCTRCGACLEECPYELPIMDMLEEAHELLSSRD